MEVSFSLLKVTRVNRKRVIPSVKIESNPYLSLNCFLELNLNLIVALFVLSSKWPWFAVGHMFTPVCKLWPVDQTGNVWG